MSLKPNDLVAGRYMVIKRLGGGGQGAVYEVADTRLGGRHMALKEMSDVAILDPHEKAQAVAAFQQEAQLLAYLSHPNIPQVYDFFTENDKHYIVMEFVAGETLEERMTRQQGPCVESEVCVWALQLCEVLDYLHGQQPPIIFRDLKPGNLMLTPAGQIKLIDFGIARLFQAGKSKDTQALGTPGYAPPEQYGHGQTATHSDLYSLGVVLHHLLTTYDPIATPFQLPPVRQLNAAVSPHLEQVIRQATQTDPAQRYQSARHLAVALMAQDPVVSSPPLPMRSQNDVICPVCKADNRPEAKFCQSCSRSLTANPSLPLTAWTTPLSMDVDKAAQQVFIESRKVLMDQIAQAILREEIGIEGIRIMLRGVSGCGGTTIAQGIKEQILRRRKIGDSLLVVSLSLSAYEIMANEQRLYEAILEEFERASGTIPLKLRNTVAQINRSYESTKDPFKREIEIQNQSGINTLSVGVEIATFLGRFTLTPPITRASQKIEKMEMHPLTPEQRLEVLLQSISRLIQTLTQRKVRVILILDKVSDIQTLKQLVPVVVLSQVYTIVITEVNDYIAWEKQGKDSEQIRRLLKVFSHHHNYYIPCTWELPGQIFTVLIKNSAHRDTPQLHLFRKFLEYHGRGVPQKVVYKISETRFYKQVLWGGFRRVFTFGRCPSQLAVPELEWLEIVQCAQLQQILDGAWEEVFERLTLWPGSEEYDQARLSLYHLMDWLLEQAKEGKKVRKSVILHYALENCQMPFKNEATSRDVTTRFIRLLLQKHWIRSTPQGLDLAGLLASSPLPGQQLTTG